MVDQVRQSGRVSRFAYAKQSAQGSYTAPTDIYNAESFDVTVNPNVEIYKTLNGNVDSESETREGVAELMGKLSGPLRGIQGAGLLKGGIGADTLSGSGSTSFGTTSGSSIVGATSITLSAPIPATPGGIADWVGGWVTIGTGGTQEDAPIFPGTIGTTLQTWPLTFIHAGSETVSLAKQHYFQPNTGANAAQLDWLSLIAQYSKMIERQVADAQVFKVGIKADSKRVSLDLDFAISALLNAETTSLTSITPAAGENADVPFKTQDGTIFTYAAAADTTVKKHARITSFDYTLTIADQKVTEGGSAQASVLHIIGERTHVVNFQTNEGEGAFSTFYVDFVATQRTTPAILCLSNPVSGARLSIYWPKCAVNTYDLVGPTDAPIARKGMITPLLDSAGTGLAVRMVLKNGVAAAY